MGIKLPILCCLLFIFLVISSSVKANTGILIVDWNTSSYSSYSTGATLGTRTITSVTTGSYSNAGNVYPG